MRVPPLDAATLRERLAAFEVQALPLHDRRAAAVALVVCDEGGGAALAGLPQPAGWSREPALLLTRRAGHLSRHAGQWALPGGRIDAGETPEAAARRELHEELGLALPEAAVIGRLDDYATRSGYVITPVLMWGGRAEPLQPDAGEVASVHRLPVAELLRADAPLLDPVPGGAPALRMPVGHSWIAAPTAAFLYQFREWMLLQRPTRVAHFDQPRFAWR
jgi:8-oxo-dGTP pyrophosphatase MutT (NUDIX family)